MKHCRDNITSKSESNVDSEVIMDETQTETEIKKLVNKWEIQSPDEDLCDNNRSIIDSLQEFNSPKNKSEEGAGQESATKKCKVSDEYETSNASTMSCWQLVLFAVRHCKTNKDISRFEVTYSKSEGKSERAKFLISLKFDDENFEKKLMAAMNSKTTLKSIFFRWKRKWIYFDSEEDSVDEQLKHYRRLFDDGKEIQDALSDLFEKIDEDYCKHLVSDEEARKAKFTEDTRKAVAIVVTGESGSGKTSFAKQYLQRKFKDASFIYKEIGTKDVKKYCEERCRKGKDKKWIVFQAQLKATITAMREKGEFDEYGIAYRTVAELSRKQNSERNDHASRFLDYLIKVAMERNAVALEWWNSHSLRMKQLVIIIDEIGKLPDLARGLVDEVRIISQKYKKTHAKEVLIVLVGSGLDGLIEVDSIPIKFMNEGGESTPDFLQSLKGFGTDPFKSEIITLKCPKLVPGGIISTMSGGSISIDTIQKGSYSKVLATNSRMLFNGVIPIMQSNFHTLKVDEIDLESRLEQIGSTNIIMDYAARVYSTLNGLKDCKPNVLRSLLLQQFIFIRRAELSHNNTDEINPATAKAINEAKKLNMSISGAYTKCLTMGIITSDIISTSKALRYLACEGSTAPLDAADGLGFEIVLQHHLYCLSRAMYLLPLQPSRGGNEEYFCGRYSLKQAWPPRSTTKLESEGPVRHLQSRMKGGGNDCDDVGRIANLVAKHKDCDLVMRQTVSNAQGADVIVLSKRGNVISLDLYQAKHLDKIPGSKTKEVSQAFSSLGVLYNFVEGKECFNTDPKQDSAGYSNECTRILTNNLKVAFMAESKEKVEVEVRNRVVVYSRKGELGSGWDNFPFKEAQKKRLWIWTGDFLEPTISALCISGAAE